MLQALLIPGLLSSLVSDVFGYEAPNLRLLADKVAASGYYVAVPDFFYGDPYVPREGYSRVASLMEHAATSISCPTVDDIKEIKAPIAVLGAEIDKISPPELLKQFERVSLYLDKFSGQSL
ncbi:hypothetical protein RJ641_033995 [Dillenia turbinata]|uniref:Dienelactone hydrolase domain-containing protein n=1 Tax=Dillenia turbinata TaxID=194707 RepID=A0AAN8VMT4_9MAGN